MNRSDLVERLTAKKPSLTIPELDLAVKTILTGMADALAEGRRVEVRGFGSFSLRHMKSRQAHNPKTGEPVSVTDKYKLHFKPGKELRDRVNQSLSLEAN